MGLPEINPECKKKGLYIKSMGRYQKDTFNMHHEAISNHGDE